LGSSNSSRPSTFELHVLYMLVMHAKFGINLVPTYKLKY
jgi:hypothetical protein